MLESFKYELVVLESGTYDVGKNADLEQVSITAGLTSDSGMEGQSTHISYVVRFPLQADEVINIDNRHLE